MTAVMRPRQPFGEIGASRLQTLSNATNRQNAITDMLSFPDEKIKKICTSAKRPFETSIFEDEAFDSENINPSPSSSKKSKGLDGSAKKASKPLFNLVTDSSTHIHQSGLTSTSSAAAIVTSTSPIDRKSEATPSSFILPSGTSSAPAGRSPKQERIGILSKRRTSLSPFKRIDPPSFNLGKSSGIPFSIDAALKGTISTYTPPAPVLKPKAPTLEDSMPKGWFFAIHEDTPDEEASIIMEHSTGILDISSDDEAGPTRRKDDRGKENIPPVDFDVTGIPNHPRSPRAVMDMKQQRSNGVNAMVDIGEERAALSPLPAKDFYGSGLDATSVEIIPAQAEYGTEAAKACLDTLIKNESTLQQCIQSTSPPKTALEFEGVLGMRPAKTSRKRDRAARDDIVPTAGGIFKTEESQPEITIFSDQDAEL